MVLLRKLLTTLFSNAFELCGFDRKFGKVVISQRPELGQFQCNGALALANIQRKNPRRIAQEVIDVLEHREVFSDISLADPGFINITLSDEFLVSQVQEIAKDERLGCSIISNPKNVIIDFGGPNMAKPMHVGHLRSTIIGDSLQRLFRFMGNHVKSDIHLGDWGTQVGMLICELRRQQPDLPYFDISYTEPYPKELKVAITDLEEMYSNAYTLCKNSEKEMKAALKATMEFQQGQPGYRALWSYFRDISVKELKEDFGNLGVTFDLWQGESHYRDRIPAMIEKLRANGHAKMSEGALVIHLTKESDKKEIPPFILVKSNGGYLYSTSDLATIEERVDDFKVDLILYVVDKRQSLHFEQVFRAACQTGMVNDTKLEHIAFGTVNGPDGKPFKTRAGGVMKLKDLISMTIDEALKQMKKIGIAESYNDLERLNIAKKVSIAALKFADLMNPRTSDYIFDLKKFTKFEGCTGPYLLYSGVRVKSILRKASNKGIILGSILSPTSCIERNLMLELCQFSDAVQNVYFLRAPNYLCDFVYNLAQIFSCFYEQCHILREKDPDLQSSWLALSQVYLHELELVLFLLGIEIPDKM